MITNTPAIKVFVSRRFLTNEEDTSETKEEGFLCAVRSVRHKALEWTVLLRSGALFSGLPINALTLEKNSAVFNLKNSQFWSNLSDKVSVTEITFLRRMSVLVKLKDGEELPGFYLFTIDYEGHGTLADTPDEWKASHIIGLDSGQLISMPNNRIKWKDASLTSGPPPVGYKVNTTEWLVEESGINNDGRWDY